MTYCMAIFGLNDSEYQNLSYVTIEYPQGLVELHYVCGSLSIVSCTLILLTYIIFKELRTLPGVILMNVAAAILANTLFEFVASPLAQLSKPFCVSVLVVIQFFALSQFSWMSIMLVEMARIYYNCLRLRPNTSTTKKVKLFVSYVFLGWGIPLVISTVTIGVSFSTVSDGLRWLSILTLLPIVVALIFNALLFIAISLFLFKSWRKESKLSKNKRVPYFRLYIGTFFVSGLIWIFALFVVILLRWTWYPFFILIRLQGLFIFLAFLFSKKVGKLYLSKFTSVYYGIVGKLSSSKKCIEAV